MKALLPAALVAAGVALDAAPAAAQDIQFTVTPYFWAAGMEGDLSPLPNLPVVHVDSDFSEIFDVLQFGMASSFEVRMDRWALVGDLSYVDLGSSAELPGPNVIFNSAGFDSKTVMSTLAVSYRVLESDQGSSVDVLGGARINWADNNVRLMRLDGSQLEAGDDQIWVDPVMGLRGVAQFSDRWAVIGYGDVGGFGVSSELTWQAMAAVNYRFNRNFAISVGYRYYAIDYENDGFVFDVNQHGPIIGTAITF